MIAVCRDDSESVKTIFARGCVNQALPLSSKYCPTSIPYDTRCSFVVPKIEKYWLVYSLWLEDGSAWNDWQLPFENHLWNP